MRMRPLVLAGVALVFALGTWLVARSWLSAQAVTPRVVEKPTTAILVAKDALPAGHLLKPTDLVWQAWPEDAVNPVYLKRGVRKPEDLQGWVVRLPISKGEPLTDERVVAPGDRGFLAAALRPGMRAVSIGVSATTGISGFIFPGDKVDILLTHVLPPEVGANRRATETILHDVRVIAIDQKVATAKADEPAVARTATLEVTPKQTEIIAVAQEVGKLSLSLRSLGRGPDDPPPLPADAKPPVDRTLITYTLDAETSRLLSSGGPNSTGGVIVMHGSRVETLNAKENK